MVQIIRYIILFLKRPWRRRHSVLQEISNDSRVMPWDCDLNFHLTNSRYPALLDLVRVRYFLAIGMLPLLLQRRWGVVVSSQTITYIREIKPFARVTTKIKVVHWDRKYLYTEDRFLVGDQIHARAFTRLAFIKAGKVASFSHLLEEIAGKRGQAFQSFESPPIERQTRAKIELLKAQRAAELNR